MSKSRPVNAASETSAEDSQASLRESRIGVVLWARIARFYGRQLRLASAHLRAWELSPAQFDVLATVGRHEGMSQQELADRLLVTQGNITQLLDKLEQRGLLRRCPEGRHKRIVLTEAGRKLHDDVVPMQEDLQARQFAPLSSAEQRQLLGMLRKLHQTQVTDTKD